MKYYPLHWTHVFVSGIFAGVLIAINYFEFQHPINDVQMFFIVMQNIGIALGNSYWLTKTHITPQGLEITTQIPPKP